MCGFGRWSTLRHNTRSEFWGIADVRHEPQENVVVSPTVSEWKPSFLPTNYEKFAFRFVFKYGVLQLK